MSNMKWAGHLKQKKIKNQSCISTEKSIKSLKKTKNSQSNLIFFSKKSSSHKKHDQNDRTTKYVIILHENQNVKKTTVASSPNRKIHLLHNTSNHQIHMTQGAIFLFFKNEMLFFHWIYFQWHGIKARFYVIYWQFPHALPYHIFFFFAFNFKKTYETNIGIWNWPILCKKERKNIRTLISLLFHSASN